MLAEGDAQPKCNTGTSRYDSQRNVDEIPYYDIDDLDDLL